MSTPDVFALVARDKQLLDKFVEALRHKFCALPRHSFVLKFGSVLRVRDSTGNWVAWDDVHCLFDAAVTDALLGELPSGVERFQKMTLTYENAARELDNQAPPIDAAPDYSEWPTWPLERLRRERDREADLAWLAKKDDKPAVALKHKANARKIMNEIATRLS